MPRYFSYVTPDTRTRRLEEHTQREFQRKSRLDAVLKQKNDEIKARTEQEQLRGLGLSMETEKARGLELDQANTRTQFETEKTRGLELDKKPTPSYVPPTALPPRIGAPTATPTPTPRSRSGLPAPSTITLGETVTPEGQLALTRGEDLRPGQLTPPGTVSDVVGQLTPLQQGLERFRNRFTAPVAALGVQLARRATAVSEKLPLIGGPPEGFSERPEAEGPLVNPIAAAFGSDKEMAKAKAVLEEAGPVASLVAEIIFDPLNLIPIIGFTKFDDFARLLRVATRAKGSTKVRALNALKNSDLIKDIEKGGATLDEAPLREAAEFDTTVREAIEQMRENRAAVIPKQGEQRAAALARSEGVYQSALKAGKSRDEALRLSRAAQAGKLARPKGVRLELTDVQQEVFGRRIDDFDFGRGVGPDWERSRVRSALVRLGTGDPVPENELLSMEKVLGKEFVDELKEAGRQLPNGFWEWGYELALVPKAVLSSLDQSAILRQNIMAVTAHPVEAKESFLPAMKALFKEDWAQETNKIIRQDTDIIRLADGDTITYAEVYDKFHTMRDIGGGLAESEERWRGQLAERIPFIGRIVRRSNAGFATFGNQMRARIMKTTIRNWSEGSLVMRKLGLGKGKAPTLQELEALSDSLNRFTGRGTFKGAGGMGQALTDTLQAFQWAPQSRVAPIEAAAQMFNFKNPRVARQAIRDVMAFVGTGTTILGLAQLAGAKVTLDPRDTDFGKIVAGKLHINIWGVSQPFARTMARIVTGSRIDPVLGPVPINELKELQGYLVSGLAPEWSAIWDIIHGTEFPGQPILRGSTTDIVKRQLLNRGAPLIVQDILEVAGEEGMLVGAATAPLSFFGSSVSAYGPSENQQLRAIPEFEGGISAKQTQEVKDFLREVDDMRDRWRLEQGREVGVEEAIRHIGQAQGLEPNFIEWAVKLNKSSFKEKHRNPEWLQFIVENEEALREQRPSLFDRNYIIDAVRDAR